MITLLDGAMGTMIQASGVKVPRVPEELNFTHPELIKEIHKKYVKAGSDVIYANTFTANRYKTEGSRYTPAELINEGIKLAREAVSSVPGAKTKVALDVGPIGKLLEPNGDLHFEDAYDMYKEMVIAGERAGADLVVFETSTDLLEMKAAVLAAKENSHLPVWSTMTFEESGRTFTGVSIASMAVTLSALGVDALGINCSLGPDKMLPQVEELMRYTDLPVIVKPNAGLPDLVTGGYDISADDFAGYMDKILDCGVSVIGGCCGSDPEFIKKLHELIIKREGRNISTENTSLAEASVLASASKTVVVDRPRVVGERINPTGKKLFKEALKKHDIGYIVARAIEQVNAGADILDVNVGLPEIDEKQMMVEVVKELQGVVDVPLQIDSTEPPVLEAALRIYNGKALVNSVNGKEEVMKAVLPIVKKYGAAVIGLTIDEEGIPDKAEDRFAIARKIVEKAESYGIPRKDIYIDCLCMSASVKQAEVIETLKAVSMVKEKLHVHTLLGVSNISFGLPVREYINTSFLTMALAAGLDLPIMNPNNEAMMAAVRAFNVLYDIDKECNEYVKEYAGKKLSAKTLGSSAPVVSEKDNSAPGELSDSDKIIDMVRHGIKDGIPALTEKLLASMDPMDIVNKVLIHALDLVGDDYEKNIIFLPQLLQSATAAQSAFDVIKKYLLDHSSGEAEKKGTIVICTVRGDIHDIGKNIVKVILENYGYDVIDLGKDVPEEAVVEAAKKYNAGLVGLSALMTTTVVNIDSTIKALKAAGLTCKVMVGGAVMTQEYADKIGADYYSKDAKSAADIAKEVFGR